MDTRVMQVGCEFAYEAQIDTPTIFQVTPNDEPQATVLNYEWGSTPEMAMHTYTDVYGNQCTRVVLPAGSSSFRYSATVQVPDAGEAKDLDAPEIAPQDLPDDVLIFTLPSRFALPDMLGATAWQEFGGMAPGYTRVAAICDYVNKHLQFQYGSSTSISTAHDVFHSGYGVCRDYTHLAISFCRALNIPARYVFGYLPDMDDGPNPEPMDFAAWMEVWLGDRWWTFDPRNNRPRKGRAVISRGRDASDVAMATTFGNPWLRQMTVVAEEIDPATVPGG